MELPMLKIFLLLFLSITANAKPTKIDDKLFSNICSKAKVAYRCTAYLKLVQQDGASSLEEVGVAFLDIAIKRAMGSADFFNRLVKYDYVAKKDYMKPKYEKCGDKYKWAVCKISEAKAMLRVRKYAQASDDLEEVSKVPLYCENLSRSNSRDVIGANEESDFIFDVSLAVVRELEQGSRK